MSIKSQKSLNDECSEIFERSYSVRSVSEESLSGSEDEEDSLSRELLKKLTPAVLSKLRRSFKKAKEKNASRDIDRRVEEVMRTAAAEEGIEFAAPAQLLPSTLYLDESGFITAFNNIFGHSKYTSHARQLFRTLDTFSSGRVWWRQVVSRLVVAGGRTTTSRSERWNPVGIGGMVQLKHCKRETIIKLVNIEREDSFCYAAVSRGGRVGVYSGDMQLLNTYEVFYHRTGVRRRVKNCWITDAIYMNDVQCLLLSASDRSLTIYDVTTLTHSPIFCITGLPNIPTLGTDLPSIRGGSGHIVHRIGLMRLGGLHMSFEKCLAYTPAVRSSESELLFGSERGDITRLRFLQPRLSLLYVKSPDNINYYYWMELSSAPHTSYCSSSAWRGAHARAVRRVAAAGDLVFSCSHDTSVSVRARHAPGKLPDYIFQVQRGVTCFHLVPSLHMLATGSRDGVVRLWESPQGSPFASLSVPGSPAVLDVVVIASLEIVVAYFSNCFLHIWDLYEECLLQTVKIKFPFLGVLGKKVEFGAYCIHAGPQIKKSCEDADDVCGPSRRGSSVYQGSTGGLILQPEPSHSVDGVEGDPENIRFNRPELLITCCDYVCVIKLRDREGSALPPPGDTLRARRPSFWELPPDLMEPSIPTRQSSLPSPNLLAPVESEHPLQDLDDLLEKAGLQGIINKDFVLMQGLKHDLNKKLYEMENNKEAMRSAVGAGAPYLALRSYEPDPLPTFEHLAEECSRVMKLFPASSAVATPITGSETSSPRTSKILKP